jgi:anaerobic selenocysteine-containing dehydrogenase
MQALTGLFARQFGTPNYAAHGGFCSVNMAAGMIYTIGGSFWEFGGPDLDRAKLFVMIGTAEDHHSNPMKIALSKFKRDNGGRFVSINPVRTGYSAIADEWVPIKPGHRRRAAAGADPRDHRAGPVRPRLPGALHQRRPAGEPGRASDEFGMFVRTEVPTGRGLLRPAEQAVVGPRCQSARCPTQPRARSLPAGRVPLADGTPVKPAFQLLQERVEHYTPEWAAGITGIPAETIRRLAHEMGITARDQKIELPIAWTDSWGKEHDTVTGNPVAFHAMRGLAAHSNGFHTIRALAILMSCSAPSTGPAASATRRRSRGRSRRARRRRRAAQASSPTSAERHAAGLAGRARTTCSSTTTASRCASTRPSRGSTRCRCTG